MKDLAEAQKAFPPLERLFENEDLLAVKKPSGLLMHRSDLDKGETQNLEDIAKEQFGGSLHIAHRLDKPTSGVVLLAKNKEAAAKLGGFFSDGRVRKEYWALVRGHTDAKGLIDYPLRDMHKRMYRSASTRAEKPPQDARTAYKRLQAFEMPIPSGRYESTRYSLVMAEPQTGRYRQIRRHMKHIFHPILGDTSHGDGKQNDFFRDYFGCWRLMLHASRIVLPHLSGEGTIEIGADLPEDFQQVLRTLSPYSTFRTTLKP